MRKPRIVKVGQLLPSFEGPIFDIPDFNILTKRFKELYESDTCFYAVENGSVFRFKKETFQPTIRKVERVECNPDVNRIYLSRSEIVGLCSDYGLELVETPTSFLVLTPQLVFISEKGEENGE